MKSLHLSLVGLLHRHLAMESVPDPQSITHFNMFKEKISKFKSQILFFTCSVRDMYTFPTHD